MAKEIASRSSASKDFAPSSGQRPPESNEAAIFAEIKQLYRGDSPNVTDDLHRQVLAADVDRPGVVAPPLSGQRPQDSDEAAILAEIKRLYCGDSPNVTDDFHRPVLPADVDGPDDVAPPLSSQRPQESDEPAIFAEIKQQYDGVSPADSDNFIGPLPSTDVDRPDDIAPPLSASKDLAPLSGQRLRESDVAATRRKIKGLYDSNLRRRTARNHRPSPAAERKRPENSAPQLPVAEGAWIFPRGFSQTIIAVAILTAIVVVIYYEYHERFLGDTLRSLVTKREQSVNEGPAGARAVQRDMASLKTTFPAQNTQPARTEEKTVVWNAQKINSFWKGVLGKIADGWSTPAAKTSELAATPVPESAATPVPEHEAAGSSKPAGVPSPEPAPKSATGTKRAAPNPVKSAAVPASPPRTETASVPTWAFRRAPESASTPAIVSFAIAPWGEIYVDGQRRGVNPPMRELELRPGQYEVEVRNTTFPAHVQTIKLEPGTHIKIKHHFR